MHDERYEVIMGSDLSRDGMFLELWDRDELTLEVFFSDADGSFTTTHYRTGVPPEVEAWVEAEARRRLPPSPDAESGSVLSSGDS